MLPSAMSISITVFDFDVFSSTRMHPAVTTRSEFETSKLLIVCTHNQKTGPFKVCCGHNHRSMREKSTVPALFQRQMLSLRQLGGCKYLQAL
jgi:hypothetical protein